MDSPGGGNYDALPGLDQSPKMLDRFDTDSIVKNAEKRGLNPQTAGILANASLEQLKCFGTTQPWPLTREQAIEVVQRQVVMHSVKFDDDGDEHPATENNINDNIELDLILSLIEDEIKEALPSEDTLPKVEIQEDTIDGAKLLRYRFNKAALDTYFDGRDPYGSLTAKVSTASVGQNEPGKDIITKLCANVELAVELGKQLRPAAILNLYIASRAFRGCINGYMLSSIRIWIADRCPEAGHIFPFKFYKRHLVPDPDGRTWGDIYKSEPAPMAAEKLEKTRTVPGLKYMQLVLGRDRYCREITAIMARNGHLMPKSMHGTLLRLWLLLDVGYTGHRMAMLRNESLWRDQDLYNAQLLFVKLGMHFNDPVFGPSSYELLHLILGQRGLYPLWQLLMRKRFTTLNELVEAKVRYDFDLTPRHWCQCLLQGGHLHGVPLTQVGTGHREGWGDRRSNAHLMRPDELIPIEAITRGLHLDFHIRHMLLWGYFDWQTGENIVPTEEDMYISDEETALAHMDTHHHWRKRHCLKKRWDTLTPEQQQAIREDDEDEQLRAMGWCGSGEEDDDGDYDYDWTADDTASLNDEIDRGFIVPEQARDHKSTAPPVDDKAGWEAFVNRTLIGMPADLGEEESLRMQGFNPALDPEHFDWKTWMRDEGFEVESTDDGEEAAEEGSGAGNVNMDEA